MKQIKPLLLLALFVSFTSVYADVPKLRLHGSNTIGAGLGPSLVEAWLTQRGATGLTRLDNGNGAVIVSGREKGGALISVEIVSHGSATAFTGLAKGVADVGMSSRPIKEEELSALAALGEMDSPVAEYVVGLDGVALIVNSRNPLTQLDRVTVARIFSGEIKDWSQIGAGSGAIHLYAMDDKSGTYDSFKSLVLPERALAAESRRFEDGVALAAAVAADPAGVGFVSLAKVGTAKVLAISERGARPLAPDYVSVATEDYALARRLFLYVPPKGSNALAREFADFAASSKGQAVVAQHGFVSQEIGAVDVAAPSYAPKEYIDLTSGARRLSVNFRFMAGAAYPDSKAARDVARLVAFMGQPANRDRKLILCGFSDGAEVMPLLALNLSIERADQLADILLQKGVRPRAVRGFGSVLPVAAEESGAGRDRNRRVEVWLR